MSSAPPALASIVLLAHGPTSATLTAARRLEPLVDEARRIVVVAATPPGETAVDRAADRGYTTSALPASHLSSLIDELGETTPGPIMVLHDDVVVDSPSVQTLCAAHDSTGLVALPPSTSSTDAPVDLVCAVGSPTQLSSLAKLAVFAPGMTTEGDFVRPHEASSTHHATCQQRRIRPRDLDRPLLVAALIVRDEEDTIQECLESLADIVDRIEVLDTGSLDRTREIAASAGAHVTETEWRDDFAWARNQVLQQCTDAAYMLWIDADERLDCDDPAEFRSMLATYNDVYPSYSVNLHNVRADGTETHSFITRRIADPSLVRFEGAIHERAERVDGEPLVTAFVTNASIRHVGYDGEVADLQEKRERNLITARHGFEQEPSETNAVQLARALRGASIDPDATLSQLGDIRATLDDPSETIQAVMSGLEAELLLEAGRLEGAVTSATATLDLVPADPVAGAVLAEALRQSNRFTDILTTAKDYGARRSTQPLVNDHVANQTRARIIFEAAIRLGDIESAQAHTADLPPELDPWPVLAAHLSTTQLLEMTDVASDANDVRFVHIAATRPDLTQADLERIEASFAHTDDSEVAALLNTARQTIDSAASHSQLRHDFLERQTTEAAMAYARSACAGQVDLALELDDVEYLHDPVSAALGIAGSAHQRRGDTDLATADALASLERWGGCTRAAVLVAANALENGDAEQALQTIEAANNAAEHDRITTGRRHALSRLATRAKLQIGDVQAAVDEAAAVVTSGGALEIWPDLLQATQGDLDASTLVLGLALYSDGVEFIDAVASSVTPATSAQLCAAYLSLGGDNPDAVSTGILAAALVGLDELALVIADHATLLPDDVRTRLAEHLDHDQTTAVANRLRSIPQNVRAS